MIDTQGMTVKDPYDEGYVSKVPAKDYPEFKPNRLNVYTYKEREELKEIIHEVLDERDKKKLLEGPYDVCEESDEWLYRGTY